MISREKIKSEIDNVENEYLEPLYKIIKAFEKSDPVIKKPTIKQPDESHEWLRFIDQTHGCLSDSPIKRYPPMILENREEIL